MKLLVVVDAQNDFITGSLRNEEAIKQLPNLCKEISEFTGNIIFTQDTHYENYLETQEGKNLPVEHCIRGTKGWEICDEVKQAYKESHGDKSLPIIEKESFGYSKWSDMYLDKLGFTEIELVGFDTDVCVISQALLLKAAYPEIEISVKENCCAGITTESHRAALIAMQSCQIKII